MKKVLEALEKELLTIRTGRANPAILERVSANYYGTQTPIKNMANITIPDGKTLAVMPFDKSSLKDIEKAIQDSGLGLTPTNDGSRLLIILPDLTSERRKELAKLVNKISEEHRVSVRNHRRDAIDEVKKDKEATEDDKKRIQEDIQKITDKYIKKIDEISKAKEEEISKL